MPQRCNGTIDVVQWVLKIGWQIIYQLVGDCLCQPQHDTSALSIHSHSSSPIFKMYVGDRVRNCIIRIKAEQPSTHVLVQQCFLQASRVVQFMCRKQQSVLVWESECALITFCLCPQSILEINVRQHTYKIFITNIN